MSALRINHNVSSMNAHRNMATNDVRMGKTLEHLASGMKINRGADGPAALVISETMRAQVAGLTQAVMNSETAVSLVQTGEAALNEVNSLLTGMRQLAIHAANEGVNDDKMLEADHAEFVNALDSIDRIARTTQFGTKHLLNGTNGVSGVAHGADLSYVSATERTRQSPEGGYSIHIENTATPATIEGTQKLTKSIIDSGEILTVIENGKNVSYQTKKGDNLDVIRNNLQTAISKAGLKLNVTTENGQLNIAHSKVGTAQTFEVVSSTDGVLSVNGNVPSTVNNGRDIEGTIGGEYAIGAGEVLTGAKGTSIEGLSVSYTGEHTVGMVNEKVKNNFVKAGIIQPQDELSLTPEGKVDMLGMVDSGKIASDKEAQAYDIFRKDSESPEVGRVAVSQNALRFQIGANHGQITEVNLPNANSENLGINTVNGSGFDSLRDIDVRGFDGAQDGLLLIDNAINKVSSIRAELGAVQKNTLESNISSLTIAKENLVSAESGIRDTDMAAEMSEFTRNQIMMKSSTAMLSQANQTANNVLSLLG
ncbi:MAG: flagellin [bacterium]|jgi:flagellin